MTGRGGPARAGRAPLRVVVCGTRFGQVYLSALTRRPEDFRLVGIVARGSARSVALAEQYGVPLYETVEQVPDDVDAACVVVSTAVGGGQGAELARAFLERGVHVLQEHPVHPAELADCLRTARAVGAQYMLNTFYPHVEPVRRFITAARRLVELRRPVFVDAMCAVQVSFDLLDILGEIFGGIRPWSLSCSEAVDGRPLTAVDATVAGVPLTLRVDNRMQPGDDSTSLFLHRVTVGTDAGNLTLVNTHGPVVWSPVLRTSQDAAGRFGTRDEGAVTSAELLGPGQAPSWKEVLEDVWPDGVVTALAQLRSRIDEGAAPLLGGQQHLTVARAWQELTEAIGYPRTVTPEPGSPLSAFDLLPGTGRF